MDKLMGQLSTSTKQELKIAKITRKFQMDKRCQAGHKTKNAVMTKYAKMAKYRVYPSPDTP